MLNYGGGFPGNPQRLLIGREIAGYSKQRMQHQRAVKNKFSRCDQPVMGR
jgi:hypothetical protein